MPIVGTPCGWGGSVKSWAPAAENPVQTLEEGFLFPLKSQKETDYDHSRSQVTPEKSLPSSG